jgi:hypothetical protein
MGDQVLFNYPILSPKVPTMFMILYDYPLGHHSYSFVIKKLSKMVEKHVFDDVYLYNLLFYTQIYYVGQWAVLNDPMVSPKGPTTLMITDGPP